MKKKHFDKRVLYTVFCIVSALMLLISLSYAWFWEGDYATIPAWDGAEAIPDTGVYVYDSNATSYDFAERKNSLYLDLSTKNLTPISGNGIKFFTQTAGEATQTAFYTGEEDDGYVYTSSEKFTEIAADDLSEYTYVCDFFVYVRQGTTLCIDKSSTVSNSLSSPVVGVYRDITDDENGAYLSAGMVAGAMRVALLKYDQKTETYNLVFMWAPNATYELNDTNKTFTQNGSVETTYRYITSVSNGAPNYASEDTDPGSNEVLGMYYRLSDNLADNVVTDVTPGSTRFRIIVWIEGTDRECNNIFSGGQIEMNLYLVGTETNS